MACGTSSDSRAAAACAAISSKVAAPRAGTSVTRPASTQVQRLSFQRIIVLYRRQVRDAGYTGGRITDRPGGLSYRTARRGDTKLTAIPVAITTKQPITLYHRNEIPVNRNAAKMAASPASMPANAPVPFTRLKKKASTKTP